MSLSKRKIILDYWVSKFKDIELHSNELATEVEFITIDKSMISYWKKITTGNEIAEYIVLFSIFSALAKKYFTNFNLVSSTNFESNNPLFLKTDSYNSSLTLKQYLNLLKAEVQIAYKHKDYDQAALLNRLGDDIFNSATNYSFKYNNDFEHKCNSTFQLHIVDKNLDKMEIKLSYSKNFIDQDLAKHFLINFEVWMVDLEKLLEQKIKNISIVSQKEQEKLLCKNTTKLSSESLIDLFEDQVSKTPNNIAVCFENKTYTFQEINDSANKLAQYIIDTNNPESNEFIGIKLARNQGLIIAILAVLKSGAAYVPIDKNYPAKRISYIENDSKCSLIINEQFINIYESSNKNVATANINRQIESQDLAYLIYTSGSTGDPKGTMITHSNAVEMIKWAKNEFRNSKFETIYASTSHCFDLSIFEMFLALTSGIKMRIFENALFIPNYLGEEKFVLLNTVPSVFRSLLEENENLVNNVSVLNLAGEEFPVDFISKFQLYQMEVRNLYGPSEDTTYSTMYRIKGNESGNVPIGKPITNTTAYILNDDMQLLPIGVAGTLYLSGAGISNGYLNKNALTKKKFIANPFNSNEILYNTGDLAQWLPDNNIKFLGRKDSQIKFNGHRIELGEIESAIVKFSDSVKQAIAILNVEQTKNSLIAYYISNELIDLEELKNYLKDHLPAYALPNQFIPLNKIPLTPNGKVDKKALSAFKTEINSKRKYGAPRNNTEKKLAKLWEKVLAVERVSIHDDFYELGGHSLLLMKLTNEYQSSFKQDFDLREIYKSSSFKNHASLLKDNNAEENKIGKLTARELYELSPSQLRFWLLYKIKGKTKEFNIYSTLELPEELDIQLFTKAFDTLIEKYEILRTIFTENNGEPKQKVLDHSTVQIPVHEIAQLDKVKNQVFNHEFSLESYPLYKVAIVRNNNKFSLLFNIHHIISDGWSINLISKELLEIYNAFLSNTTTKLSKAEIHYKDYAKWQNDELNKEVLQSQKKYWNNKLSGDLPYTQLPLDYAERDEKNKEISAHYSVYLPLEAKVALERFARERKVSVFAIFTTTLKIIISRITAQEDIIIGIPVANRNHYQLKDMLGCFLNTLMLKDTIDFSLTFSELLKNVNQTLLDGLANQNYPFEYILKELNVPNETNRFPLSSIFLNMLDFEAKSEDVITNFNASHGTINAAPKFDFECYLKTFANALELRCVYNNGLFNKKTIAYWIDELIKFTNKILENPSLPVEQISMFDEFILKNSDPSPKHKFEPFSEDDIKGSISERFEKQVLRFPNRIAIQCEGKKYTYEEVNQISNCLAHKIQKVNSLNSQRVGLLINHEEHAIMAMLAVLKAGLSYVPIDPTTPKNRIKYSLEDSGCTLVICTSETKTITEEIEGEINGMNVINFSSSEKNEYTKNLDIAINPKNEAYVLYTSGSTGMPKGVVQNQGNVLHYIRVYTNNVKITSEDNLSLFSTYTFDASVKDIYGALLNGASVNLYSIAKKGFHNLSDWLHSNGITIIHMVPTFYRNFIKLIENNYKLESVRLLDMGGEACIKSDFEKFKKHFLKGALLVNDYGPTEATIVSQKFLSHSSEVSTYGVPIGTQVANTEVFLWNKKQEKVGVYMKGEIVFKSKFLFLKYLNKIELTKEVLISGSDGEKIYKSGDIGKLLPSGEIEFLRRKDTQIKINGLRIELAEIEHHLQNIEGISQAVVLLKELEDTKHIVAYINFEKKTLVSEIKKALKINLPTYMVPSIYIKMEIFPLTRTGKIDKSKLRSPLLTDLNTVKYVAPKSKIEIKITEIWAKTLNRNSKTIGMNDNFFELGGNSLRLITIINLINTEFNTTLSVENLYNTLTISDIVPILKFNVFQTQDKKLATHESDEVII